MLREKDLDRLEEALGLLDEDPGLALMLLQPLYRKYPHHPVVAALYGLAWWSVEEAWEGLEILDRAVRRMPALEDVKEFFTILLRIYAAEGLLAHLLDLAQWGEARGLRAPKGLLRKAKLALKRHADQPLEALKAAERLVWREEKEGKVDLKAWQDLWRRYPGFLEVGANLAYHLLREDPRKALEAVEEVLERAPDHLLARAVRAQARVLLEGPDKAREKVADLLRQKPPRGSSWASERRVLVELALMLGEEGRALELAGKDPYLEDYPPLVHAAYTQGRKEPPEELGPGPYPSFPPEFLWVEGKGPPEGLGDWGWREVLWAWLPHAPIPLVFPMARFLAQGQKEGLRPLLERPGLSKAMRLALTLALQSLEPPEPEGPVLLRPLLPLGRFFPLDPKEEARLAEGLRGRGTRKARELRKRWDHPLADLALAYVLVGEREEKRNPLEKLLKQAEEALGDFPPLPALRAYLLLQAGALEEGDALLKQVQAAPAWPEPFLSWIFAVQMAHARLLDKERHGEMVEAAFQLIAAGVLDGTNPLFVGEVLAAVREKRLDLDRFLKEVAPRREGLEG
ncbi:tetratricopeptide repeat protein [Thermus filiformis]|uniref:Tetratricopeptide repeat domain protein n=1 Tax=Thermus filiformis TaxID=276 RepID=A0A0D6XAP2_THEFI|nr:hypothetical protein [Thermus filiformis]KIX84747.1 hypothetical protein THFILI_01930 [Thermus filiformis]